MVLHIDLAPTLTEMAGVAASSQFQGQSLLPILSNNAVSWRKSFLIEYYSDNVFPRIVNMGYKAVRSERYKYIHYTDLEGMDELYDLQSDHYELKNSIQDQGMARYLRK